MHTSAARANAVRHSIFRWTFLWLGCGTQRQLRGKTFATRLTDADRSNSLAAAGARDKFFRVIYPFENEQLAELINRTAHVAALTALIETPTAYRYYLAVYVRNVSPFTPFYMAMINPCRRCIVYPSFLRDVRARWNQAFGNG
jgi:Protein of unknown function (DUF2867)